MKHEFYEIGGRGSKHVETYTFYKNGMLKWTNENLGLEKYTARYKYTIAGNRIITTQIGNDITTEETFCINDNKLSLFSSTVEDTWVLTRVKK